MKTHKVYTNDAAITTEFSENDILDKSICYFRNTRILELRKHLFSSSSYHSEKAEWYFELFSQLANQFKRVKILLDMYFL